MEFKKLAEVDMQRDVEGFTRILKDLPEKVCDLDAQAAAVLYCFIRARQDMLKEAERYRTRLISDLVSMENEYQRRLEAYIFTNKTSMSEMDTYFLRKLLGDIHSLVSEQLFDKVYTWDPDLLISAQTSLSISLNRMFDETMFKVDHKHLKKISDFKNSIRSVTLKYQQAQNPFGPVRPVPRHSTNNGFQTPQPPQIPHTPHTPRRPAFSSPPSEQQIDTTLDIGADQTEQYKRDLIQAAVEQAARFNAQTNGQPVPRGRGRPRKNGNPSKTAVLEKSASRPLARQTTRSAPSSSTRRSATPPLTHTSATASPLLPPVHPKKSDRDNVVDTVNLCADETPPGSPKSPKSPKSQETLEGRETSETRETRETQETQEETQGAHVESVSSTEKKGADVEETEEDEDETNRVAQSKRKKRPLAKEKPKRKRAKKAADRDPSEDEDDDSEAEKKELELVMELSRRITQEKE